MTDIEMDREVDAWIATLRASERSDPAWGLRAYAVARYLLDHARFDAHKVGEYDPDTSDQLKRAVASIGANIGEGYGRVGNGDRRRFFAFALGSAREAATWYAVAEEWLGAESVAHRLELLARVRRLLFGLMKAALRDSPPARATRRAR